jgi:hypothetical protein
VVGLSQQNVASITRVFGLVSQVKSGNGEGCKIAFAFDDMRKQDPKEIRTNEA